jgi:hypothetical protein
MKKKTLSTVAVTVFVIVAMAIFTGCPAKTEDGFEVGFVIPVSHVATIVTAARSDKRVFDVDDATFDLYYGGYTLITEDTTEDDILVVAIYFLNAEYYPPNEDFHKLFFEDYRDIEGFYLIKEIGAREFNSRYKVSYEKRRFVFAHKEAFTVPRDIFKGTSGEFSFIVAQVVFDAENNKQTFLPFTLMVKSGGLSCVMFTYKLLDDATVRITARGG